MCDSKIKICFISMFFYYLNLDLGIIPLYFVFLTIYKPKKKQLQANEN